MFEWLESEISAIKTPRFHKVDGRAEGKLREAVLASDLPLPPSYREFVLKFGNARLYRRAGNNSYQVGVFGGPRLSVLEDGARIYHVGFHDDATVYVKAESKSTEPPIFSFVDGSETQVAASFEEWLKASCASARRSYGKSKWADILRGPRPFTAQEKEIVDTRRRIQWRVLGIDSSGDHIIEVRNTSSRSLAVLTVGVRSKNGRLNGAVRLQIGHVRPGQSARLHVGCYKDLVPATEIEVFSLPEPHPEDREQFAELGDVLKHQSNPPLNKIKPISPRNKKRDRYLDAGRHLGGPSSR